jgi:hypothetical protein
VSALISPIPTSASVFRNRLAARRPYEGMLLAEHQDREPIVELRHDSHPTCEAFWAEVQEVVHIVSGPIRTLRFNPVSLVEYAAKAHAVIEAVRSAMQAIKSPNTVTQSPRKVRGPCKVSCHPIPDSVDIQV